MATVEEVEVKTKSNEFSSLRLFLVKVCVVTTAAIIFVYFSLAIVTSTIEDEFTMGGPAFWVSLESNLDKLASWPDLPPEKKQKIINDIRALSAKYRPYIDAIKD